MERYQGDKFIFTEWETEETRLMKKAAALVVNVTVPYEFAFDTLELARSKKITHHLHTAPEILEKFPGVPVGTRAMWPTRNNQVLRHMEV